MSVTTEAVKTNDFKVKNPELVSQVLEQLGFNVVIYADESINATADANCIDDTTHVVINGEDVEVYGEQLCNLEDMDEGKAITFTEFMQDQLLDKEYMAIYVVGTESRISGIVDTWSYVTCITKKAQKDISLDGEVYKFLAEEGIEV